MGTWLKKKDVMSADELKKTGEAHAAQKKLETEQLLAAYTEKKLKSPALIKKAEAIITSQNKKKEKKKGA